MTDKETKQFLLAVISLVKCIPKEQFYRIWESCRVSEVLADRMITSLLDAFALGYLLKPETLKNSVHIKDKPMLKIFRDGAE